MIPRTVASKAPLSMGFSSQEYWSGLPFLSPGDLPDPGIGPRSPALQADSLLAEPPGSPQFSSAAQSCPTLFDPIKCSKPGLPVHHQHLEVGEVLEFTQTHVHRVGDAIQPSHPVVPFSCVQSFPASRSFQMNQFSTSGGQSIGVSASASFLPKKSQG